MPRSKGSKSAPKPSTTHCATCGKPLPAPALRAVFLHMRNVLADLNADPPEPIMGDKARRWFRGEQVGKARAQLELILEEESDVCFGHAPGKRGPRKPRDPAMPEPPSVKRRGRPRLAAVPDG